MNGIVSLFAKQAIRQAGTVDQVVAARTLDDCHDAFHL
jgi:hypothetical protein